MIAKIVIGGNFAGVVHYILDQKKAAELLAGEGIRLKDKNSIVKSFVAQTELNSRVTKPVGHISLDFSIQDTAKLSNEFMLKVANDYLALMVITNTQFVIARHYDKAHPHIHIVFNRINNRGKTITNKNDRYRSEKICKELTRKYDLYFAKGKENVNVNRLKEPDKSRYEIYNLLNKLVPQCNSWQELENRLNEEGIGIIYKFCGKTNVVQGISFTKDKLKFNGSKVDKKYSYSKIDYQLTKNRLVYLQENYQNTTSQFDSKKVARLGAHLIKPKFEEQKEKDTPKLEPQKKKRRGYRI